jgi:putative hemolysin
MAVLELGIIALMILLNGVFAAYELALASVKLERLKALAEQRLTGARAAVHMKGRMEGSLAVVQLGITVLGYVAGALGGANAYEVLTPALETHLGADHVWAQALALAFIVLPLSAVTIMVGELIPKVFALRNAEMVCVRLSPLIRLFAYVVYPVVWFLERATKAAVALAERLFPRPAVADRQIALGELRAQVGMLRASQVIGVQQEQIIVGASRLSSIKVRDIMLPAEEIVMLAADAPLTENLIIAHLDLHTRFPVAERKGDAQSIIGYANFKEMMFLAKTHPQNPSVREITRPLIALPADMPVSEALRQMVAEHVHLAVIRDPANTVIGMVTQEDVFEELVGDIQDEFDRMPRQITPSGRQFVVGGGATLARLRQAMGRPDLAPHLPPEATANEWICRGLRRHPHGGDTLTLENVSILVRKVRRHKVNEALLDPTGAPLSL